jgi:beta-lactamase regulating signal transducer with metallopeptidase domain
VVESIRFALPFLPISFAVLVKVSLILGVAFAAAQVLRRAPARLKHLLWLAAIGGSALIFLLALHGPLFHVPARPLPTGPVSSALLPSTSAFATPSRVPPLVASVRPVSSATRGLADAWPLLVALAWAAGVLFGLLRLAAGRLRFSSMVRGATKLPADHYRTLPQELCRLQGLHRPVRILESTRCATPLTRGVLRPVILLPVAIGGWPASRKRSVLLHELRHIARGDSCSLAVAYVIRALLWFVPPLWLACTRLYQEQEKACDAAVIGSGVKPYVYASCLLEATRLCREPELLAGLGFSNRRKRFLEDRIHAVLRAGTTLKRGALVLGLVVALLAAGVAMSAAGMQGGDLRAGASRGTVAEVRAALDSGADSNETEFSTGFTLLMLAARSNRNPDVIRELVRAGARVDEREHYRGTTPLFQAALSNDNPAVVEALLEAGADASGLDYGGSGVMHYAALGNHNPAVVAALARAGAPVDQPDGEGRTPLMVAVSFRNIAVIPALLRAGADGGKVSIIGKTAFELLDPRLKGTEVWTMLDRARR